MHFFFLSLSLATEPIVAPPAADDATSQHTATQGFTYDPASGYYYDANTGLYYDSNTGVNEIDFFFFFIQCLLRFSKAETRDLFFIWCLLRFSKDVTYTGFFKFKFSRLQVVLKFCLFTSKIAKTLLWRRFTRLSNSSLRV